MAHEPFAIRPYDTRVAAMFAEDQLISTRMENMGIGLGLGSPAFVDVSQYQPDVSKSTGTDTSLADLLPESLKADSVVASMFSHLKADERPYADKHGKRAAVASSQGDDTDPELISESAARPNPDVFKPAFLTTSQALKLSEIEGQLALLATRQRAKETAANTLGPYHRSQLETLSARVEALTRSIQRTEARVDASLSTVLAGDRRATMQDAALDRLRERCASSVDQAILRAIKLDAMQEQHALDLARQRQQQEEEHRQQILARLQQPTVQDPNFAIIPNGSRMTLMNTTPERKVPSNIPNSTRPTLGEKSPLMASTSSHSSIHEMASRILQSSYHETPRTDRVSASNSATPKVASTTTPPTIAEPTTGTLRMLRNGDDLLQTSTASSAQHVSQAPAPTHANPITSTTSTIASTTLPVVNNRPQINNWTAQNGVGSASPSMVSAPSDSVLNPLPESAPLVTPITATTLQDFGNTTRARTSTSENVGISESTIPSSKSGFVQELSALTQLPPSASTAARARAALLIHEAAEWRILRSKMASRLMAQRAEWQRVMGEYRLEHARNQELKELELERLKGSIERLAMGEASEGWVREEARIAKTRSLMEELERERALEAEYQAKCRLEEERAAWREREREREKLLLRMERKQYEEERARARERAKSRRWARKILAERLLAVRGSVSVSEADETLEQDSDSSAHAHDYSSTESSDESYTESSDYRRETRRSKHLAKSKHGRHHRAKEDEKTISKPKSRRQPQPATRTSPDDVGLSSQPGMGSINLSHLSQRSIGVSHVPMPTHVQLSRDEELESIVQEPEVMGDHGPRTVQPASGPLSTTKITLPTSENQPTTESRDTSARLLVDLEQEDIRLGQVAEVSHLQSPQKPAHKDTMVPFHPQPARRKLTPPNEGGEEYEGATSRTSSMSSEALVDLLGTPGISQQPIPRVPAVSTQDKHQTSTDRPNSASISISKPQSIDAQESRPSPEIQNVVIHGGPTAVASTPSSQISHGRSVSHSGSEEGSEDMYVASAFAIATSTGPRRSSINLDMPRRSNTTSSMSLSGLRTNTDFLPSSGQPKMGMMNYGNQGATSQPDGATGIPATANSSTSVPNQFQALDFGLSDSTVDATILVGGKSGTIKESEGGTQTTYGIGSGLSTAAATKRVGGVLARRGILGAHPQHSDVSDGLESAGSEEGGDHSPKSNRDEHQRGFGTAQISGQPSISPSHRSGMSVYEPTSKASLSQGSSMMTFDVPSSPPRPRRFMQGTTTTTLPYASLTQQQSQQQLQQQPSMQNQSYQSHKSDEVVNNQDPLGLLGIDDTAFDF